MSAKRARRQLVRIRDRNQITLPAGFVDAAGLSPGDYVELVATPQGSVEIRPARIAFEGSPEAAAGEERARRQLERGEYVTLQNAEEFRSYLKGLRVEQEQGDAPAEQTLEDAIAALRNITHMVERLRKAKNAQAGETHATVREAAQR